VSLQGGLQEGQALTSKVPLQVPHMGYLCRMFSNVTPHVPRLCCCPIADIYASEPCSARLVWFGPPLVQAARVIL
jgi:hypothetical protein